MLTNEAIVNAVKEAIAECHSGCYPDEHREFINAWILRERRKSELWSSVQSQVLGWGIIAIIGAFGAYAMSVIKIKV